MTRYHDPDTRRLGTLAVAAMMLALALAVCGFLAGCGHTHKPDAAQADIASADNHNTAATTYNKELGVTLATVQKTARDLLTDSGPLHLPTPFLDTMKTLPPLADTAVRQSGEIQKSLDAAKADNDALRAAAAAKDKSIDTLTAKVNDYDHAWLGGKARAWLHAFELLALGLFAAGVLLQAFGAEAGGLFGKAIGFIGRVFASVVPFISTMVHDFYAVMARKKAVAAVVTTPAPPPAQPPIPSVTMLSGLANPQTLSSTNVQGSGAATTISK